MNHRIMFGISMAFLAICLVITTSVPTIMFTMLVMGIIPGTDVTVPAWAMLVTYPIIMLLSISWLARQPMFVGSHARRDKTARALARKRMTKRATTKPRLTTTRRRYRAVS